MYCSTQAVLLFIDESEAKEAGASHGVLDLQLFNL
jgi:hypothetical protein